MSKTRSYEDLPVPTAEELLAYSERLARKEELLREQTDFITKLRARYEEDAQIQKGMFDDLRREIHSLRASTYTRVPQQVEIDETPDPPTRVTREHRELSDNFSVKQAVELVPKFDGTSISVLQFIRACKRAREVVPQSAERTLTKLICNKLQGRAYAAVEDEDCCTISDLCNRLRSVLGPYKFVDQYRGELASVSQSKSEHILDYITRVKDLRTAVIDATEGNIDLIEIDDFVAESFLRGMIPKLRSEVRLIRQGRAAPLPILFDESIAAYKQYELDKSRYSNYDTRRVSFSEPRNRSDRRVQSKYRQRDHSDSRDSTPERYDTKSHVSSQRESWRNSNPNRDAYRSPSPQQRYEPPRNKSRDRENRETRDTFPTESQKFCKYCKIPGHDIHECRKRARNNDQQSGNERGLPIDATRGREAKHPKPQKLAQLATQTNESPSNSSQQ